MGGTRSPRPRCHRCSAGSGRGRWAGGGALDTSSGEPLRLPATISAMDKSNRYGAAPPSHHAAARVAAHKAMLQSAMAVPTTASGSDSSRTAPAIPANACTLLA